MPIISIIVPVYKTEKYLERCVDSLRNQTFQDIEIILVDDGSPDKCPQMCDEMAAQDSRVRVIHKENGGVSSARNEGLDAARGEFVTFVDSDDWIDPQMYTAMIEKAQEYNCDVVLCDCVKEYSDRTELYTHDIRPGFYDRNALKTEYFQHLLMMENVEYPATISNWLLLFRRELVKDIRYLTGVRYSEDLLFGAELLYRADSFYYLKRQAFYHYRMHPASATHRFVDDKWQDYRKLHAGIREAFGNCADYDFSHQIDLCLLFFLYNAVGDIYGAPLTYHEKKRAILQILNDSEVRAMLGRLRIASLPVSRKLRLITLLYRCRFAVSLLIRYYGG